MKQTLPQKINNEDNLLKLEWANCDILSLIKICKADWHCFRDKYRWHINDNKSRHATSRPTLFVPYVGHTCGTTDNTVCFNSINMTKHIANTIKSFYIYKNIKQTCIWKKSIGRLCHYLWRYCRPYIFTKKIKVNSCQFKLNEA